MRRLLVLLCVFAFPAWSMTVPVRSGEHDEFSRLVIMLPKGAAWHVSTLDGGFRLESDVNDPHFQLQDIFRLIPRTRLEAVTRDRATNGLLFETAKGVSVRAFQLRLGGVVLDFYDAPVPGAISPDPGVPAPDPAAKAPDPVAQPAPQQPSSATREGQPVAIGRSHLDLYWQGVIENAPVSDRVPRQSDEGEAMAGSGQAASHSVPEFEPVDGRVAEVEDSLRHELARAASQGLIKVERPALLPRPPAPEPEQEGGDTAKTPPDDDPSSGYDAHDHIAFKSETSIDQASPAGHKMPGRTETGLRCAPDSLFDLSAWTGEGDASDQISQGRRALIGEFDKPDPDAVIRLARTYLAFGFGAESRALLRDFGAKGESRDALTYLADLFDERPEARHSPFTQMTGCDGYVALWGLLGADPLPSKDRVNFAAIQRTYRGLSLQLRQTIGPDLVARLIALGAPDIARAIRPALSRVTNEDRSALDMVDAQLDLNAGRAQADAALKEVVAQDGPHAVQALLLRIENRLRQGQAIDAATTQNARALAFELKGDRIAYPLLRAAALGAASVGDFDQAFELMQQWPDQTESALRDRTRSDILKLLVALPDDGRFLSDLFAHLAPVQAGAMQEDLRFALATRLIALGFAATAQDLLAQAFPPNERDRVLLGKAALSLNDAVAALTHLEGLKGPEVDALRARAFAAIGEHGAARMAYSKASDTSDATREAWRDGDWDFVRTHAQGTKRAFAETFAPQSAAPDAAPDAAGPLDHAEALIDASQKEREMLREMLGALALPADPSPGLAAPEVTVPSN